jgi:methyl-accepting chemotaxis protein
MPKLPNIVSHGAIAGKLVAMAVAGALFMACVAVIVLLIARAALVTERTEKAHAVVDAVWNIADSFDQEVQSGAMTADEAQKRFFAAAGSIWWEGHTNYAFIYDTETGLNRMNTGNKAMVGKDMRGAKDARGVPFAAIMFDLVKRQPEGTVKYAFPKGTDPTPLNKIAYFRDFRPWHLLIVSAEYMTDIDATFWHMARTAATVIGILMLFSFAIAWAVGRSVVKPLSGLRTRMAGLSAGDLESPVPGANRHDEVGEMARAVLTFKEHMIRENELAVAHEAVRQQAQTELRRAALVGMADTVEAETGSALEGIGIRTMAMAKSADAMSASASRTGISAQDAATAAAQALANAQTVASAAEQLAASIREISGQVGQSTAVVSRAVEAGSEARTTIEALNQEVERIGAVADMIGEIASKTNLLALNATIEAARAGDAGRGFAVVASEVKALATQTAHSTQEIARHIGQVRLATGASVAAVGRIERTITEMDAIAASIATAVEEQGASTAEIARNVAETASAANKMTSRTNEVSTEAVDTGRLAADVRDNIIALNQVVEELRHSVIRTVRTSTSDVDRRQTLRRPVDLSARLGIAGQREQPVRISDLSEGGAQVRNAPVLPVGTRGTLHIDGLPGELSCIARGTTGDDLHMEFAPDDSARAAVRSFLGRMAAREAA